MDIEFNYSAQSKLFRNKFPFRVGDIVKVTDWGCSFSTYPDAYLYFKGENTKPYFCQDKRRIERDSAIPFKIIALAQHHIFTDVLAYIQDRKGRDHLIGIEGLKLVRQYPLRKGETTEVKLEKIKNI